MKTGRHLPDVIGVCYIVATQRSDVEVDQLSARVVVTLDVAMDHPVTYYAHGPDETCAIMRAWMELLCAPSSCHGQGIDDV